MADAITILKYTLYSIFFPPVFLFLFILGFVKSLVLSPFVFLIIGFGIAGIVIGLCPCHLFYSIYCIIRTKKFGPWMKCLLILLCPIPIALWIIVGVVGSVVMAIGYAFVWPYTETFKAISREGVSIPMRLIRCFTDGTYSTIWGACTIVRDFADLSFHSYFSVMDELLEAKGEKPIEIEVPLILGYILCAAFGIVVDAIFISLVTLYKAPVLLLKGWNRLLHDLIGREGPFLETVCVPFAGLLIICWPVVVLLAIIGGIASSIGFGCYSAVVAYQEGSLKNGLLYIVASVSIYDEYTNDLLYLREGSCFPRPRYRKEVSSSQSLRPVRGLHEQLDGIQTKEPLLRTLSEKKRALSAMLVWDNFLKGCELVGKELLKEGAITKADLDAWQQSKNKIVNIGIPAYVFLGCFLRSIKSGSTGFLMGNNVEVTSLNRPEGRVFDWLFDPMSIMKEQIRKLKLVESEELYLFKLCLYSDDVTRMDAWDNGGAPPHEEIRRAQLEGIARRLRGFCLTLSRLPTFRRRFSQIVKEITQESDYRSNSFGAEAV